MNGYKNLKLFKRGRGITGTNLVAYHIELIVMSWNVTCSWLPVKYGKFITSCNNIEGEFSEFTTTSRELTTFLSVSACYHDLHCRVSHVELGHF